MDFKQGDKVQHPKMVDWGMGKVMEVMSNGKVRVFLSMPARSLSA